MANVLKGTEEDESKEQGKDQNQDQDHDRTTEDASKEGVSPGGSKHASVAGFQLTKKLGSGSFGVVYKAHSLRDKKTYALKKISIAHMNLYQQRKALKEAMTQSKLIHPNIAR